MLTDRQAVLPDKHFIPPPPISFLWVKSFLQGDVPSSTSCLLLSAEDLVSPLLLGSEFFHQVVNVWVGLELGIVPRTSHLQLRASVPGTRATTAEHCPPRKQSLAPDGFSEGVAHPDEGKRGSNFLKRGQRRLVRALSCQNICTGTSPQLRFLLTAICTPEKSWVGWAARLNLVTAMESDKAPQRASWPVFNSYLGKKWGLP